MTFKDENRALQETVRELLLVRDHNLQFKEGDPQRTLLMFAETGLVFMVLEHFLRVVLGNDVPAGKPTLHNLLEKAVAMKLIDFPWDIKRTCDIRNAMLHGNFPQAAREAGCESVAEYFKKVFAVYLEEMDRMTDYVMGQINPETGQRRPDVEQPKRPL